MRLSIIKQVKGVGRKRPTAAHIGQQRRPFGEISRALKSFSKMISKHEYGSVLESMGRFYAFVGVGISKSLSVLRLILWVASVGRAALMCIVHNF